MKPFRAVALICMFALGGANARSEQTTIGYHKEEALRLPVGEARIRYRYIGEPVSNPARLAISIQCLNTDKERLLEELTICDWKGYRYDHALKSLMINLVYGRVDQETGQSYCDHDRAAQILVDVCQRPSSRGADKYENRIPPDTTPEASAPRSSAQTDTQGNSVPSKEETLEAIRQLYEGQNCTRRENDNTGTWYMTYNNFNFASVGDLLSFTYHVRVIPGDHESTYIDLVFNPADIATFTYSRQTFLFQLNVVCARGEDCIHSRSFGKTFSWQSIDFCDSNKRDRIYRAISYLQKLYKPSKRLPF